MSVVVTRSILALAGLTDFVATVLLIVSYHAHANDLTVALEFALLPWQVLHVFSWFGSLLVASGGPGRSFGQMALAAYIGAFFGDIVSLLWRAFVVSDTGELFVQIAFWTTFALIFIDGANMIFLWLAFVSSPETEEEEERRPWSQTVQRRILPWMWILEVVFIALQITFYALGLNRSPAFSRIILLEVAHSFVWLLHRVITGGLLHDDGIRKRGWFWLGVLVSGALSLTGAAASMLRIFYIVTDRDEPAVLLPSLAVFSGWSQFSFGVALFVVALLQLVSLGSIMSDETVENLPLVKEKM